MLLTWIFHFGGEEGPAHGPAAADRAKQAGGPGRRYMTIIKGSRLVEADI